MGGVCLLSVFLEGDREELQCLSCVAGEVGNMTL